MAKVELPVLAPRRQLEALEEEEEGSLAPGRSGRRPALCARSPCPARMAAVPGSPATRARPRT